MNHYKELLFLKCIPGIGTAKINKVYVPLIRSGADVEALTREVFTRECQIPEKRILDVKKASEAKALELTGDKELKIITLFDPEYPPQLLAMEDNKPLILYAKGDVSLLSRPGIAVIGTRHPGNTTKTEGMNMVKKLISLAEGRTIVSGLALGCDKIGHTGALDTNTPTIAVLPGGFNNIAPASHTKLAERIVTQSGCLLSEYEPDSEVSKYTYIQRDKLTAALSDGIVVLECGVKSGTMHTVNAGFKLKRTLAAWNPESRDDGDFAGNMLMIEKYRACPLTTDDDIAAFVAAIEKHKETKTSGQESQSKQSTLF